MTSRNLFSLLGCMAVSFATQAANIAAADMPKPKPVQQATITLSGDGPFYQLSLPTTIYPSAAYADLRDVRILNASGAAVPYAWLQQAQQDATAPEFISSKLPVFPLKTAVADQSASRNDVQLSFTQKPDGSLISISTGKLAAQTPASAGDWIIDASQVQGQFLQARVSLADNAEGLFPLTLEASDDLHQWHSIGGEQQLAILKQQGAAIERLTLDLYGVHARFLRLHWLDSARSAAILSFTLDSVKQLEMLSPLQWSSRISAISCEIHYCDYLLPKNTPIDSLRIRLAEINTLADVQILGELPANTSGNPYGTSYGEHRLYHSPLYALHALHALRHKRQADAASVDNFIGLTQSVLYRLKQGEYEVESENLPMNGGIYPRLRLQTAGAISLLGATPPTIEVASTPRNLAFLARGNPPFSLQWGVDQKDSSALPLATLLPAYRKDQVFKMDAASVNISAATAPVESVAANSQPPATKENKSASNKIWLWAALAAGLLLLGGMAWSLFRTMSKESGN